MYAGRYFPARYFARRYYDGGSPASTGDGQPWARGYFAGAYFAPRYFGTTPPVPGVFVPSVLVVDATARRPLDAAATVGLALTADAAARVPLTLSPRVVPLQ